MAGEMKITPSVDTSRFVRALTLHRASAATRRINHLLRRGHHRGAESVRKAYYFEHGITPAEHAVQLRTEQALASARWSPQP